MIWIQTYRLAGYEQRRSALDSQYLPQVLEEEERQAEKPAPIPLPVKIDQEAAIKQCMETEPPLKLKPPSDYPGYDELVARSAKKANGSGED